MTDNKRGIEKIDLSTNLEASVKRLEELKRGRLLGDIPHNDEYWRAVKKHRAAYNHKGD